MERYRLGALLGSGTYGDVLAGTEIASGAPVAVKRLRGRTDGPGGAEALREVAALRRLKHPCIVELRDVTVERGKIFLVFERLGRNLCDELRARGAPLSDDEARRLLACLLSALARAHSQGFVHRDVKPENLLMPALGGDDAAVAAAYAAETPSGPGDPFNNPLQSALFQNALYQEAYRSDAGQNRPTKAQAPDAAAAPAATDPDRSAPPQPAVPRLPPSVLVSPPGPPGASAAPRPLAKLADFGLARRLEDPAPYTEYVSTRWYRSPELLLRSPTHDPPADIFAAGAVFYEALAGRPLFPGDSEAGMLGLFAEAMGTPSQAGWDQGARLADELGVVFASDLQGQGAAPGDPGYAAPGGPPPGAPPGKLQGARTYPWRTLNAAGPDAADPAALPQGPSLARAILDPSLATAIAAPDLVSPGAARIIAAMCAWDPAKRPTAGDLLRAAVLGSPLSSRLLERAPARLPRSELRVKLAKAMRHALTSEWVNGARRAGRHDRGRDAAGDAEAAVAAAWRGGDGEAAVAAAQWGGDGEAAVAAAQRGGDAAQPYPLESRGGQPSERTPSPRLDAAAGRPRPRSRRPYASHGWARAAVAASRGQSAGRDAGRGRSPAVAGGQPTPTLNAGINAHIHAQIQANLIAQRGGESPLGPSGLLAKAARDPVFGDRPPATPPQVPSSPTLTNFTGAAGTVIERAVEVSRQPSFLAGPWGPELRLERSLGASSTVDGRRATVGASRGRGPGAAAGDQEVTSPRTRGRRDTDATDAVSGRGDAPGTARGGSRGEPDPAPFGGAPPVSARGLAPPPRGRGHRSLAALQRRRLGGSVGHAPLDGDGGGALATSRFHTRSDEGHAAAAAAAAQLPARGRGAPVGAGRGAGARRPPRPPGPADKLGGGGGGADGKRPQPAERARAPPSGAGTSDGTWVIPAVKADGGSHPPE